MSVPTPAAAMAIRDSLEEEVLIALVRAAWLAAERSNAVTAAAGLSPSQYNVLRILRAAGRGGLACAELGTRMVTRDSDLTRLMSGQDSPPRPAARRMRRTLYCDGESPAAAVTALDRSAASHAARTSAISTSSSSESRIAIAAAGGGTDMGDNYSSRGVFVKACGCTTRHMANHAKGPYVTRNAWFESCR